MTDSEDWRERRNQVARYRVMEQEATDPLAAGLLRDIVLELEADLNVRAEVEAQLIIMRDCALALGIIEFHERAISCLVRSLSEHGAVLDMTSPCGIPDRFILSLPLDGATHRCHLVWRREMKIGVAFHRSEAALM